MVWQGLHKVGRALQGRYSRHGIFPKSCLTCGQIGRLAICESCHNELESITPGCRQCGNPSVHNDVQSCSWCDRLGYLPDAQLTPWAYRNRGRDVFHWVKYQGYWRLLETLCRGFERQWSHHFSEWEAPVLVSVPESFSRRWRRKFNPAAQIAKVLARQQHLEHRPLLKMRPFQPAMVGLGYKDRRKNARRRFMVKVRDLPPTIILVDDVLTTGATLEAASKTLRAAGVKRLGWFCLFRTL